MTINDIISAIASEVVTKIASSPDSIRMIGNAIARDGELLQTLKVANGASENDLTDDRIASAVIAYFNAGNIPSQLEATIERMAEEAADAAIENYDFDSDISKAIEDIDFDDKIAGVLNTGTFSFRA